MITSEAEWEPTKSCQLFLKCHLDLPVVRKVSGVVGMKSIDMHIGHDRSLVVCFSKIMF